MSSVEIAGHEFQMDRRLVEVGRSVTFFLKDITPDDRLDIFPRYLENADAERARKSPQPLHWLDGMERQTLAVAEEVRYEPPLIGNYIARWTSARHGTLYRYFAVIDQTCLIYRPAVWSWPTPFPATGGAEIHNGGLPLDWCLGSADTKEPYIPRLLDEQRVYGGGVVLGIATPPETLPIPRNISALKNSVTALREVGLDAGRVCNLWYGRMSTSKVQTAIAAGFDVIDGYVPRAGVCGMGAPYFPFYISPIDYRFPSQDGPTPAIACVFDFVGSWHFHGPIGFHRPSAGGNWERARHFIDLAAREAALTVQNSGVHNFVTTLINFESPVAWQETGRYGLVWDAERGRAFFEQYMHLLAFEHTRRWPVVFARAVDYADYMRDHYTQMPRRIVSSITHDIEYSRWWTDEWHERRLTPAGYVPVSQSLDSFRQARLMPRYNAPVSFEFINYNDNRRTCRFEYACPKPVHYYDLTGQMPWPTDPVETAVPDPDLTITATAAADRFEVTFDIANGEAFEDYLLAIWDIPRECRSWTVHTNAKEYIWVENTDGHFRGVVRFDLEQTSRVTVTLRR